MLTAIKTIIARFRRFLDSQPVAYKRIYEFDKDAAIWIGGVSMAADNWETVDGRWSFIQVDPARRPTVVGNALRFNGTNSWMGCDELASRGVRNQTVICSFNNVAGTGNRVPFSFSNSDNSGIGGLTRFNISANTQNLQLTRLGANQTVPLAAEATVVAGGTWRLCYTMNNVLTVVKRFANPVVNLGDVATNAGFMSLPNDYMTIGARLVNPSPVPALFFQGDMRYVIVGSRLWSDKEIAVAAQILTDAGLY